MPDEDPSTWPTATYQGGEEPVHPSIHSTVVRAAAVGLKCGWQRLRDFDGTITGPVSGFIQLPSGADTRSLIVDERNMETWEGHAFEQWLLIDGYDAIWDPTQGSIIAAVELSRSYGLRNVPGIEMKQAGRPSLGYTLKVSSSSENLSISLTQPSPTALQLLGHSETGAALVISGFQGQPHRGVAKTLNELANSFFVDLAICFDVACQLKTHRAQPAESRDEPAVDATPRFPINDYNADAASLYLYARTFTAQQSASLQYLAYYQVIEYFAPVYARRDAVTRLRNAIKDPAFDLADDSALGRVVGMLTAGRNILGDRQQVTTTVGACVEEEELAAWLDSRPIAAKALADKTRISGIHPLHRREKNAALVTEAANRIYNLRCRIVHAKEDGQYVEPLRIFDQNSQELLQHDIALVRFVAERVLIKSSQSRSWA
ncbi:hypothetical protein HPO96_20840 [Kribbella sandramycini]|uniref:Uncharacterized protein n=1 Tax=Kribbella sandramycini TaxID=60450 RepID=A0A7Y4L1Q1_9ACTN|nr:hypothetical protein [Kribbella sandramycini]MBB6566650.1 hypothetical protein [Kribbella sandramycini]NOL42697.1 hypothetical protein [Kribbella sandramycini]